MPCKAFWHTEDFIVLAELLGTFTLEEMDGLNVQLLTQYLNKGESPVHIIADVRTVTQYPRNFTIIRKRIAKTLNHPAVGWVYLIGFDTVFLKHLGLMVMKSILDGRFKFVNSIQEAEEHLRQQDPRLNQPV